MAALMLPITAETFEKNWNIVDTARRRARKKYVTTKVASFFSNMVFALLILIAGNGLIHDHLSGSYCSFLEKIPYLLPIWESASSIILKPDFSVFLQITVPLLVVYLICFVICGIFVLIVTLLYHPLRRKVPTNTVKENASQMLTMARDARRYANRSGANGSMLWALIFMMIQFAVIAMYWLIELKDTGTLMTVITDPIMNLLTPHLKNMTEFQRGSVEMSLFAPSLMVFCLSIFLAYTFVNHLHALSVQFMYKYKVPYSFVADVEYYYIFADEKTDDLTDEEIMVRRKDTAEAKRIEALDLERIGAYGKAKELLAAAAHGGDVAAMEHYGRHWLIGGAKDPGRYWLQKCVDTGEAGEYAIKTLRRLKWHLKYKAKYLK